MSLAGLEAAYFLPLALLLYWLVPQRAPWQNAVLLVASYVFYASWSMEWLPLLLGATLFDFVVARFAEPRMAAEPRTRRRWLVLGLVANLGLLGWFKYRSFFLESLTPLLGALGLDPAPGVLAVALPIGLSYYTLIKVGYLLDVYQGRVPASRSLLEFATFVAFFPQVVAGPITRAGRMLPQLAAARRLTADAVLAGGAAFLTGWVFKAYIADWIAPAIVDPVFAAPGDGGAFAHWLALVGYAIQVFGDFAGYSLLAIGTARWFGLELPVNFDRPFLSTDLPEFWRRWHISLNTWLFDYLYGPWVTGSSWLRGRLALALVLVFALSGLWHGAQWTFVVWGLLHGLALAVHHGYDQWYRARCRVDRRWVERRRSASYLGVSWGLTQLWFLASLILFRAADLRQAGAFARGLLGGGSGFPLGLDEVDAINLLAAFAIVGAHHLLGLKLLQPWSQRAARAPAVLQGAVVGLLVVWLLIFAPLGRGTFIYAQF
ncbi:MAG: MBOAT family O-acyltransferase [Gemmatimonadaceae bacterium]